MYRVPTIMLFQIIKLLSLIPFRVLYYFSDVLAWLAHDVVGYRRKVVTDNLRSSFPDKSDKELRAISRKFYRFLGDYIVETIKLASMSEKTIRKRMRVENAEELNEAVRRGQSVSIYLGHYCNWEWVSSLPLHIDRCARCAQVYHPLSNKAFDRLLFRLRTRFDANNIPMADIMQTLIGWKRAGVPSVTGYIADQVPGLNIHLFVDFLNHDTLVYTGPERISKFLGAKAVYAHITRPRRGYYVLRFIPICENAKKEEIFTPSREYFRLLEENIKEAPQYWLWSHRRWKRTREQFYQYHGDKAAEMLSHL
ncbi:MAG: lysophospholipid acyltransferase family protein [Muribaculaceae bacterium]|nr:lysophospholipid acyltransferase family protein [Muribaculaceae bacterium]